MKSLSAIPFCIELFYYLMLNFCFLALSFRSQKSDADSVQQDLLFLRDDVFEAILSKKASIKNRSSHDRR